MSGHAMAERLARNGTLSPDDLNVANALPESVKVVRRGRQIVGTDVRPEHVSLIKNGWAARYSIRNDGSRRITGIMQPGDFCGIHAMTGEVMDHAVIALSECTVGRIPKAAMAAAIGASPNIGEALWRSKLIDEAILRVWLLNSQSADQALAHLICELYSRAEAIGAVQMGRFQTPLTQEVLGDALGISSVHVNRMLRQLREAGLAEIDHGKVIIHDLDKLRTFCCFSDRYLYLPGRTAR